MVKFTTSIHKFGEQGEKTGWTYIEVPADIAQLLKPGNKKTFRVKGKLDKHPITAIAIMPRGDGSFIMPLNKEIRKGIHKKQGAMLEVQLSVDKNLLVIPPGFLDCLSDEPAAKAFFDQLKPSHRNYYIKWLGGVKGEAAVAKRIAQAIDALAKGQDFAAMHHSLKAARQQR